MSRPFRMLGVFAHPDDETYGPGGAIAEYAIRGVEIYILVFTCGEAGSIGISKYLDDAELCRRRRAELGAACDALGVAGHRIVGVADKGVGDIPEKRGVAKVLAEIERFEPHVLLTFHHGGVSGHPDHIAVARFLESAFDEAGERGPLKLYEFGILPEVADRYQRPSLVPMEAGEVDAVVSVSDAAMDRKVDAIHCHVTQIDFYRSLQAKFDYRAVTAREAFTLRRTRLARPEGRETDLFAGVPGWKATP